MTISIARFLSKSGLENINGHKYKPSELTPLDQALRPWLDWLVEFFPMWLAPNLVTFSGVGPVLISLCLLFWQCPTTAELVPRWILLLFAVAASFYIIMDALDGKQARRTGSSSPLGQLFDHGVDCMTMLPYSMFGASAVGVSAGRLLLSCQMAAHMGFFLAQWQEHHTGIMATKFGPIGVTEVGFSMAALVMVGGLIEPQTRQDFAAGPFVSGVSTSDAFAYVWIASASVASLCSLGTVFSHLWKRDGVSAILRAALDLFPTMSLVFGVFVWSEASLIAHSRAISCFTAALAFLFTAQMILSSMSLEDYQWVQPMAVPYVFVSVASLVLSTDFSGTAIEVLTVFAFGVNTWWLFGIIGQLRQRLGVRVFHIAKRSVE